MKATGASDSTASQASWQVLAQATRGLPPLVRARALLRLLVSPLADVAALVPRGARVFDVGCGTGAFLALVARTRAPAALYGSELDSTAVLHASTILDRTFGETNHRRVFQTGDPTAVDALRECDLITLIDVLHHVPADRQQAFVTGICAALRPGAAFLLKEIDRSHAVGAWINRMHDRLFGGGAGHERSAATLEDWLRHCGLRVESSRFEWRLWYPHVTLLARKPAGATP